MDSPIAWVRRLAVTDAATVTEFIDRYYRPPYGARARHVRRVIADCERDVRLNGFAVIHKGVSTTGATAFFVPPEG